MCCAWKRATVGNCRAETGAPAASQSDGHITPGWLAGWLAPHSATVGTTIRLAPSTSQPAKPLTAWLPKNCHSMAHRMEVSASPVALRKPTGHASGCSCCQSRVAVLLGVGKMAAAGWGKAHEFDAARQQRAWRWVTGRCRAWHTNKVSQLPISMPALTHACAVYSVVAISQGGSSLGPTLIVPCTTRPPWHGFLQARQ